MLPRIATVWEMAGILVAQRVELADMKPIGENWVGTFVKHHSDLQSKFNCKYDYQRAKCEDPVLIQSWFKHVQDMKIQYGILDDDVLNFNKTGFQMGVIATRRAVSGTDRAGQP